MRSLMLALGLILAFMVVEIVAGIVASSLALLSDAGHMLTDAAALAMSLAAARLAARPAFGAMTYGLGRAEILSAQANGLTLLVLAGLIIYGAIAHLISPPEVRAGLVLAVALVGIPVNLLAARTLMGGHDHERSLNVEGSYRHILTDLYGFIATAIAAAVILATGFDRADAIASLFIAGLMLHAAYGLLKASGRVFMEAAPAGLDPAEIGRTLAGETRRRRGARPARVGGHLGLRRSVGACRRASRCRLPRAAPLPARPARGAVPHPSHHPPGRPRARAAPDRGAGPASGRARVQELVGSHLTCPPVMPSRFDPLDSPAMSVAP